MNPVSIDLSAELVKRKIRPSIQRIKILQYLNKNRCHPTADQIYKDLQGEIPTISKTTIYNTLYLFTKAGLVSIINFDDHEARYDIITALHGHFKCQSCHEVFNFKYDADQLTCPELASFKVTEKNVYFKGICPKCLKDINFSKRKEQCL